MIDTPLTNALWLSLYLMVLAAVVARADVRQPLIHEDRVEIIERNIVYHVVCGTDGPRVEKQFTQLLFRDETRPDTHGNRQLSAIVAWCIAPEEMTLSRDHRGPFLLWDDKGTLRRVRYRTWAETGEGFDTEVAERAEWPMERRRGLR